SAFLQQFSHFVGGNRKQLMVFLQPPQQRLGVQERRRSDAVGLDGRRRRRGGRGRRRHGRFPRRLFSGRRGGRRGFSHCFIPFLDLESCDFSTQNLTLRTKNLFYLAAAGSGAGFISR